MATSPTSKSALLSGAAKDDVVGLNGDYNFTINDLLANDPGGAAKVEVSKQFFFGDAAPGGGIPSIADQVTYLAQHGITANLSVDGKSFVSFDIGAGATDIQYFVQIGNKGTWSQGDVDVHGPHVGDNLFTENFDGYDGIKYDDQGVPLFEIANLDTQHGWTGAANSELGANGYGTIATTSGSGAAAYWLDTQNSPGGINISHTFSDNTGGKAQLSFDIAVQNLDFGGGHYETNHNASIAFKVDGNVVASMTYDQIHSQVGDNNIFHVDAIFDTGAAGSHTLQIVDTSDAGYAGFAVDTIHIDDYFV